MVMQLLFVTMVQFPPSSTVTLQSMAHLPACEESAYCVTSSYCNNLCSDDSCVGITGPAGCGHIHNSCPCGGINSWCSDIGGCGPGVIADSDESHEQPTSTTAAAVDTPMKTVEAQQSLPEDKQ